MDKNNSLEREEIEKLTFRCDGVEGSIKKLSKNAKKFNENILSLNHLECKLSEDLSNSMICQQYFSAFRELVQDWHTFNCKLNDFGENLGVSVQKLIIDPMKRFHMVIHELKMLLKKREHLYESSIKLQTKVNNLSKKEKTGPNVVHLEKSKANLNQVEDALNRQTALIKEEVPLILDYRINYFQPSLEGLIKSKVLYWGDAFNTFKSHSMMQKNQSTSSSSSSWDEYSRKQTQLLNSISSLSIVEGSE